MCVGWKRLVAYLTSRAGIRTDTLQRHPSRWRHSGTDSVYTRSDLGVRRKRGCSKKNTHPMSQCAPIRTRMPGVTLTQLAEAPRVAVVACTM